MLGAMQDERLAAAKLTPGRVRPSCVRNVGTPPI
jgi:hypothetical protein